MSLGKINIKSTLLIILICAVEIIIIFLIFNFKNTVKQIENLKSINVRGYDMDNKFNPDLYEYNLIVNDNIIEISCESDSEIEGCNISIDLTGKKEYKHEIIVNGSKKTKKYIINIKNETKITNEDFYIKAINGNTFEWTNKDITLEVIPSNEGVYMYSFDNGLTWQESNKYIVKENGKFNVIIKNNDDKLSDVKTIEVDKIDKKSPQVTINKVGSNSSKITLEVVAYDNLSGADLISFNGSKFSLTKRYEVSKTGKYYVEVKDKVGNVSEKKYIEIKDSDFVKTEKSKTYTLTLNGNGAIAEKNKITCKTTTDSCEVILPKIITDNFIIGWSTNKDSKEANYKENEIIKIDKDLTLYAITEKNYTAIFDKNAATSVSNKGLSCIAYNEEKCEITTPTITADGTVLGWGTSSDSTKAIAGVNEKIELTNNVTYYAITKNTYTATFNKNGAESVGSETVECVAYNKEKCRITTPTITRNTWNILGWSVLSNSTAANINVNSELELNRNITLYAITQKKYTATFNDVGLNYLEDSSRSCLVYNTQSSCSIVLPEFNKAGQFNSFWSTDKKVSSNLFGKNWSWDYFKPVGSTYSLNNSIDFYPNFNHFNYNLDKNYTKYRTLNMSLTKKIGNSLFEFEKNIPDSKINEFLNSMNSAYKAMPWLFIPGKTFVMNQPTYLNYSIAYGLTHTMYSDSYYTIDLQYDENGVISVNAALHEMGHAWDHYYRFKKDSVRLSSTTDFYKFYNLISDKLWESEDGDKISTTETFAGMVTNYYWHVLGIDTNQPYYALKDGVKLSSSELQALKTFMEKYISIANNNYR